MTGYRGCSHSPTVTAQNASASPPYRFGSSFASMWGSKADCKEEVEVPTTAILAKVAEGIIALNAQKIQVNHDGTLIKNFL